MVKTHHLLLLNIMSRGITLTEEQAEKLTVALATRYHEMAKQPKMKAEKDSFER